MQDTNETPKTKNQIAKEEFFGAMLRSAMWAIGIPFLAFALLLGAWFIFNPKI